RAQAFLRNHAHGELEPAADYSHDQRKPVARHLVIRRFIGGHRRRNFDGDQPVVVDRRPAISISVFDGDWLGDQGREAQKDVEESQLQRNHHRVLEFLRCHLQARALDPVGHAQLRERAADANDGYRARRIAFAVSECADWSGFFQAMSAIRKSNGSVPKERLMAEGELRRIVDTVLRLAKSIGVAETEVHVDETISALTRFANNGIHQNVAEHTLNVSVRTQVNQRTARATTNRTDEDSLRAAIEASLSLAHSEPKNPNLLPMPGKQRHRGV